MQQIVDITKLWDYTFGYGYMTRLTGANGLNSWQPLKETFIAYSFNKNDDKLKTLPINQSFIDLVNELTYINDDEEDLPTLGVEIDDTTMHNDIELEHFFVQHFRIVKLLKTEISVLKLMQISYNAGQFAAEEDKHSYPLAISNFYDLNGLGQLKTYINISEVQTVNQTGGQIDYLYKYKKYKRKYLDLESMRKRI